MCPQCGKGKLLMILPDTAVRNLPCKCKRCQQEFLITVVPVPETKVSSA